MKITLAITGASGSIYAQRLARKLCASEQVERLYVVLSKTARKVAQYELGKEWWSEFEKVAKIELLDGDDFFTPIASGSNCADVMVIVPCSMGMVGRVANGISNDLISRAADVTLKECKKLIVVPRETPLSLIHLKNLVALKEAGTIVLSASPSFYSAPQTIEDLVDTVVERILEHCDVENNRYLWMKNVL